MIAASIGYRDMEPRRLLAEGAGRFGEKPDALQIAKMMAHMRVMIEWNAKMNLTAIEDEHDIILKHFIDSISIMPYIRKELKDKRKEDSAERRGITRIMDIGSGAGFPGLPVAIMLGGSDGCHGSENCRDCIGSGSKDDNNGSYYVDLIDSLGKRVKFLEEAIKITGYAGDSPAITSPAINSPAEPGKTKPGIIVRAVHARAEDSGRDPAYREKADVVTARAVAALPVLLEYCLPFVRKGGIFIAMKGSDSADEIEASGAALKALGGEIEDTAGFSLPFSDMKRVLIIVRKVADTPAKYPRRAGKPEEKPIH